MAVSRLVAFVALAFCFVAGYLLAGWWWSSARDRSPIAQICARVDYVNGLVLQKLIECPANDFVAFARNGF